MRKIRLDADTLRVDSFAASDDAADARGTVAAHGLATRNCPATGNTCDCTLGCNTVPCTTS